MPLDWVQNHWKEWAQIADEDEEQFNEVCTSYPQGAVQLKYACRGWIPILQFNLGNMIGIDLSPGPKGRLGQVILFGRDEEVHFVVGQNWADFLEKFAEVFESVSLDSLDMQNPDVFHDQFNAQLITPPENSAFQFRDGLRILVQNGKW